MTEDDYIYYLKARLAYESERVDKLSKEIVDLKQAMAQLQCDLITERLKRDRLQNENEELRKTPLFQ